MQLGSRPDLRAPATTLTFWPRRIAQIVYLSMHWPQHRSYARQMRNNVDAGHAIDNGYTRYKYLGKYLAWSRSRNWRRDAILSHYAYLHDILKRESSQYRFTQTTTIWKLVSEVDATPLNVVMQPSRYGPMEGELELSFNVGNLRLATLTFIFVQGKLMGSDEPTVCVIGAIQGGAVRDRAESRRAAKVNGEVAPFAMLLIALKALCDRLALTHIFAVSSSEQVAIQDLEHSNMLDYNAFWSGVGSIAHPNGFYLIEPKQEKVQPTISSPHWRRTRKKRKHKARILSDISLALSQIIKVED